MLLQSKVSNSDFRYAVWFDCFARRRFQSVFILLVGLVSYVLLIANLLGFLGLTNVELLCCIAVGFALPLLVFSCEQQCFIYRSNNKDELVRLVDFKPNYVKFSISGRAGYEKVPWHLISCAYELNVYFLVYRDNHRFVMFHKAAMSIDEQATLRNLLREKLGKSFVARG